jgi:hypothetical protein
MFKYIGTLFIILRFYSYSYLYYYFNIVNKCMVITNRKKILINYIKIHNHIHLPVHIHILLKNF